jgi:myo-inositol catabolism protein IolS
MLTTKLHADIELPSVGLGTWAIGGPYWTDGEPTGWGGALDDSDSIAALRLGIGAGLAHIDTADVYGHGRSERLVGSALSGLSTVPTVASKVGFVPTSCPSVYTPENIKFQIETSLRNLGLSHLDIYYVHHCDFGENDQFLSDAAATLRGLQAEGKVRAIGLSGYSAEELIRVSTVLRPQFIQSWASIEHPEFIRADGDLAQHMTANGIGFVAMMPLGQGRLLGKYNADSPPVFEPGDNRGDNEEFSSDSLRAVRPRIDKLQQHFGGTTEALIFASLGFVLAHPVVTTVIPGFRNTEQVKGIIEAVQRTYSPSDHEAILDAFPYDLATPHPWSL